ncbi:hypothetical protein Avbf_14565 [Armadillidium vulgare]|nr:hypothetical protein Avbf_14565 [Armadillidium vulgare]
MFRFTNSSVYDNTKRSCIRRSVNESRIGRSTVITSWLYLLPIQEERLALKKHKLPRAPLRPVFRKEKIRWARHCQDIYRFEFAKFGLLMGTVLVLQEIIFHHFKAFKLSLFFRQHNLWYQNADIKSNKI